MHQLRGKHASEELFEVWFLAMEISDSLAHDLFHFKAIKRASRISQKSASLFAVIGVRMLTNFSCNVFYD